MTVTLPETTDSYGAMSLVALTSAPADLEAVTLAEITAGENISAHMIGDWWPTAAQNKVTRQRKMFQTRTNQKLGTVTWDTPRLRYTYNPQTIDTPGSAGNEAYEALPEGAEVYLLQRLGKAGDAAFAASDTYRAFPVDLGVQVPGVSAEDEGGESIIDQEVALQDTYDAPVDGVVAAA